MLVFVDVSHINIEVVGDVGSLEDALSCGANQRVTLCSRDSIDTPVSLTVDLGPAQRICL